MKARDSKKTLVWFHVASAGEWLQAQPVIQRCAEQGVQCVLTYTSINARRWFDKQKETPPGVLIHEFIPLDRPGNAKKFLDLLRPSKIVWVSYDLWPNHVWEAARRGITVTTEAATEEVLEREVRVRAHPATQGYTYGQVVELATHRTLEEVLQSKKFATEVLLRLITEQEWDESRAEEFYTENRGLFQGTSEELDYATHRLAVWKEIRQRTYQDLHQKVRIVRRQ